MKLKTFNNNNMGQNTYLYYDEKSGEGVIIDAGCSEGDINAITAFLNEDNITVKGILLTHGHYDHIIAVEKLKNLTAAKVCSHKSEAQMLESPALNLSTRIETDIVVVPDKLFGDGDTFDVGGASLKVIHTPGHTTGGVCYYDNDNGNLFTGDTLFKQSVGRTDLASGSHRDLAANISNKLFALPDNTKVYPGHGPSTTVGYEKTNNPFVP